MHITNASIHPGDQVNALTRKRRTKPTFSHAFVESSTVNFCKSSSKPWRQTVLPKFLVRIHEHIALAMSFLSFRSSAPEGQFGKLCVSEFVAGILTARPLKYSSIDELDRKIRDVELPQYALNLPPDGASFSVVMLSLSKCVLILATNIMTLKVMICGRLHSSMCIVHSFRRFCVKSLRTWRLSSPSRT